MVERVWGGQGSRGDGLKLLFGNAVVQGGLEGSPGVANGCWWVIRVVVEGFDEIMEVEQGCEASVDRVGVACCVW